MITFHLPHKSAGPKFLVPAASISALMLTAVAVVAGVLGVWRFAADPGWTGGFFIADGLLSRYQVWLAIAIGTETSALLLNRWIHTSASLKAARVLGNY